MFDIKHKKFDIQNSKLQRNRRVLLKALFHLTDLWPKNNDQTQNALKSFCEILIDYASYGHFQLYPKLMQQLPCLPVIQKTINNIDNTTHIINQFNQQYEHAKQCNKKITKTQLSKIGLTLTSRLELEDKLFRYYKIHQL